MSLAPASHGLWGASAPPAPPAPPLQGDAIADVAIVGGGYTGLSAALHLAEGGASAVVLEARELGFGGSGRNVGLVNAGMWVMPDALPQVLGPVYGARLLDTLGDAPSRVFALIERHGMDCQAVRRGTLHCAVGTSGLREVRDRFRQWQARGAPVALLDAAEIARATGTPAYTAGLLDRRAGTLQPLAYVRGLARAALDAGARLHAHTPVQAVIDEGASWLLRTPGGSVRAHWILVATNAYTDTPWRGIQDELVRLPYFNMATPPLPDRVRASILPNLEGAWDTRTVLSSYRFDRQGRLVFGSVGALERGAAAVHRDWGRRELARLFPALAGIRFEHEWYGQIGMTRDALPRLHALGRNTISMSGYNGRGIAPGTVFGGELAALVLGQRRIQDLCLPLSAVRPRFAKRMREAAYRIGSEWVHFAGARHAGARAGRSPTPAS